MGKEGEEGQRDEEMRAGVNCHHLTGKFYPRAKYR